MNHIYRIVWNNLAACWQVVAETAKSHGKSHSRKRAARSAALIAGGLLCVPAWAGPTGGQVTAGSATINQAGSATTINQSSQNAAINWQTFSVGKSESVRFNQPNASAITLNRVTGAESSQILGSLTANGQVFILNPNGVLFGKGAQVNVGGIVASTGRMSDADFMAGNYKITGANSGSVINDGNISVAGGGVVAFIAPVVSNTGTLSAPQGSALLAGAEAVTLNLQDGSLVGYTLDKGSLQAMVDNGGLIQADGGHVVLTAKGLDALSKAAVNHSGIIEAQTVSNKNGVVELLGDMEVGQVILSGKIDASAPNGGDGGFVETSAAKVKVAEGTVIDTRAPQGKTGEWLIDPDGFTIESGANGDIAGNTLTAILSTSNASVVSTNGKGTDGNVNVNESVSWNANRLRLSATNDININANLNGSGTARLELEYGQGAVASGNTADYHLNNGAKINLPAGDNFSTKLGSDGAATTYAVITDLGVAGDTSTTTLQGMGNNLSGNYALGADVDASATKGWNGGTGWVPIGYGSSYFFGNFHGLGHSVSNLNIDQPPVANGVGMFSKYFGQSIRDIGLLSVNIVGARSVGALVGELWSGTISDCYSTGSLSVSASGTNVSGTYLGGLVGYNNNGLVIDSHSAVVVTSSEFNAIIGGLVGRNDGQIRSSYSEGNVTASGDYSYAGGLAGEGGTIQSSSSSSTVIVTGFKSSAGGLVASGGTIQGSFSTGSVSAAGSESYIGGLTAVNGGLIQGCYATGPVSAASSVKAAGGLAGYSAGSIESSYSSSSVTAPIGWNNAGGLVGWIGIGGTISRSYSTGPVSGSGSLGGLVGFLDAGVIQSSYSTGSVTSTDSASSVGGLVGWTNNITAVTSSYWNTETSGQATSAGGTGLTTAQMQQQASFTGWDFTNTWRIVEGSSYPLLRSLTQGTVTLTLAGSARDAAKTYDGVAWSGGSVLDWSGLLAEDTLNGVLQGTLTWGGTSQGAINVGEYSLLPSGLYSQKYEIVFNPGTLYIAPRPVDISVSKTHNGNRTFTTGFVIDQNDVLPADRATLHVTGTATVSSPNVGTYTSFATNYLETDNPNYTANPVNTPQHSYGSMNNISATIVAAPTPDPTPDPTPTPTPDPTPTPTPTNPPSGNSSGGTTTITSVSAPFDPYTYVGGSVFGSNNAIAAVTDPNHAISPWLSANSGSAPNIGHITNTGIDIRSPVLTTVEGSMNATVQILSKGVVRTVKSGDDLVLNDGDRILVAHSFKIMESALNIITIGVTGYYHDLHSSDLAVATLRFADGSRLTITASAGQEGAGIDINSEFASDTVAASIFTGTRNTRGNASPIVITGGDEEIFIHATGGNCSNCSRPGNSTIAGVRG